MPNTREVRYDGIADWYDGMLVSSENPQMLVDLLGPGRGLCLDLGCGTGRYLEPIASTGRSPIGMDLSADQLRLARSRSDLLVRADGERIPFRDGVFQTVVAAWISSDIDDFAVVAQESARVLVDGGTFVFYGVHPCFNGPCVENRDDGARIVHPSYRRAERHLTAPWWGADGIRYLVGGMNHLPLAELITALIDAGLSLNRVVEPGTEPIPSRLAMVASKTA